MNQLKRTPMYEIYQETGVKTIDFGGWELPVQFSSIKKEHEAVRTKAGLFDVSHMGEVEVKGKEALPFLQLLMTNDVSALSQGQVQYTAMCYEDGGTVDDLIIYKKADDDYLLVINASNIEKDLEWLHFHEWEGVSVTNRSSEVAQLALQGPIAEQVLQTLTATDLSNISFFRFQDGVNIAGVNALVSRTGYTGEDGFEIYCDNAGAPILWKKILDAGANEGVVPCGLGARDTLRFEARLPLYGQELTEEITPIEAGIGFAVKVKKQENFFGKVRLKQQKEVGPERKLVGIEMIDKGIPRTDYPVYSGDKKVGTVTTGTQSPTLKKNIGLALLDKAYTDIGTEVSVDIRNKQRLAKVIKTPFYKRSEK
ncbi:glycine cleavage system aminomethyltransferase GcvT [Desertibacillus haloalkaliphilus]|uniref:glycine cleavage system aminomethyltransferase GcvT n=1 Tax=Desertibacillus haloalkaliphilus TaxID=1328930 RepID=UPI001C2613D4|nr:glycine cleavage system aminomethyltransferase GcvT [Desertibacillus haloalkaliphilus]MBU8908994.1 glycine cleavage system aminomethyltransferase GcvT [Desertibacillus haloalkaliphilus]